MTDKDKDKDVVDIFAGVRLAGDNPVEPVRLQADDSFCFSCHKSVSCWNRCCRAI